MNIIKPDITDIDAWIPREKEQIKRQEPGTIPNNCQTSCL